MPFGIGTLAMQGSGAIAAVGFIPMVGVGTAGFLAGSITAITQGSIGAFGSAIAGAGAAIASLIP